MCYYQRYVSWRKEGDYWREKIGGKKKGFDDGNWKT